MEKHSINRGSKPNYFQNEDGQKNNKVSFINLISGRCWTGREEGGGRGREERREGGRGGQADRPRTGREGKEKEGPQEVRREKKRGEGRRER